MPGYEPEKKAPQEDDEEYENSYYTNWFCCCGILEWLSIIIDVAAVTLAVLYLTKEYNDDFTDATWEDWPAIVHICTASVVLLFVAVPKAICCLGYCCGGWDPEAAGRQACCRCLTFLIYSICFFTELSVEIVRIVDDVSVDEWTFDHETEALVITIIVFIVFFCILCLCNCCLIKCYRDYKKDYEAWLEEQEE